MSRTHNAKGTSYADASVPLAGPLWSPNVWSSTCTMRPPAPTRTCHWLEARAFGAKVHTNTDARKESR